MKNNNAEKIEEQAMRLFEALENVDPVLLERSEQGRRAIPFRKYAGLAAAALVFLAVGGSSLYGLRFSGVNREDSTGGNEARAGEALQSVKQGTEAQDKYVAGGQDMQWNSPESGEADGIIFDRDDEGAESVRDEAEPLVSNPADPCAFKLGKELGDPGNESGALKKESGVFELGEGAELLGVMMNYLPKELPEGYCVSDREVSAEGSENDYFLFRLESAEGSRLEYRADYMEQKDSLPEEVRYINAEGLSGEMLEGEIKKLAQPEQEYTEVAVLYGDGVCVRISGDCSAEILWELIPLK